MTGSDPQNRIGLPACLSMLAFLFLGACGGGGGADPATSPPPPSFVSKTTFADISLGSGISHSFSIVKSYRHDPAQMGDRLSAAQSR